MPENTPDSRNTNSNPVAEQQPHSGVQGYEKPVYDFDGQNLQEAIEQRDLHVQYDDKGQVIIPDTIGDHIDPTQSGRTDVYEPLAPTTANPEKKSRKRLAAFLAGTVGAAVLGGLGAVKMFGDDERPAGQLPSTSAPDKPGQTTSASPESAPTPEAAAYGETMPAELQTYADMAPSEFATAPIQERLAFADWLNRDLEKMAGLRADNLVGPEYDLVEPSETNTGQQILDHHYATVQSAFLDHDLSESGAGTMIDKDAAAKLIYSLFDGEAPSVQNVVTSHIDGDLASTDELHTLNVDVSLISEQPATQETNAAGDTVYRKQIEIIDNNFGDTATIEFELTPYTDALGNEKQAWVRVQ